MKLLLDVTTQTVYSKSKLFLLIKNFLLLWVMFKFKLQTFLLINIDNLPNKSLFINYSESKPSQ